MSSRWARVGRGLAAAGVATFVAALSHVAAGGGAPGGAGLALAIALSAVVCVLLAGRSLSLPRLAISVLISQFAFHLLFEVGAGGGGSSTMLTESGHHGHLTLTTVPDAVAESAHPGHDSGMMWVMHAVAAVVTIVLIQRGERTLVRLAALARAGIRSLALVRVPAFVEPLPRRSMVRAEGLPIVDRLRDLGVLLGGLRHRGPPVAVVTHN
jgi:hypothetical protein